LNQTGGHQFFAIKYPHESAVHIIRRRFLQSLQIILLQKKAGRCHLIPVFGQFRCFSEKLMGVIETQMICLMGV